MSLTWVSADLRTGAVLAYLPDLECSSIRSVIGAITTAEATLPVPTAPENWERAVLPWASALVLLDDDEPVWGGVVNRSPRSLGDVVDLSLVTVEGYLDRRFVGDHTYTNQQQTAIVGSLVTAHAVDAAGLTGLPFRVIVGASTTMRDDSFADAKDQTLFSALTGISGHQGGPEWTCWWEWNTTRDRLTPVLEVRDRLGIAPVAGLAPAATFDAPGCVSEATLTIDYSAEKGATDVLAVSTGSSTEARPQSSHHTATSERPMLEHRFTPSTSITQTATLDSHAAAALAALLDGARALELTADLGSAPRLGRDWRLGDDIGVDIVSPALTVRTTARAVGWAMDMSGSGSVTPILAGGDI